MLLRSISSMLMRWSIAPIGVALVSLATMQPVSQAQPPADEATPAPPEQQPGTQILTRGPIHEGFGQPTIFNPKPGLAIPKKPPQVVEELPPDEKPEGDNVAWIGGYWSWDEEKNDFMWISGFWRVLPPGRQWMPGYWNENGGQYQWVSGYWAGIQQQQQEVIAQPPPDSLDQGPPATAVSQEQIWVPGCWVYRDVRYMWRPGYWVTNQPGWAWVPSTYIWTPSGYVYVEGYWDWSIRRRGVLFAPCYMDPVVVYRPGFYYRPAVCLDIELLTPHFFCRPAYCHYYFGDYYAASYLSIGITPWFNVGIVRGPRFYSYDFAYYECHYRHSDPHWAVNCRLGYERCRDYPVYRPARTYVNQVTIVNNTTIVNNKTVVNNNMALAKPMKTYTTAMAKNPDSPMKFEKINDVKAREFSKTATEVRKVGIERSNLERSVGSSGAAPGKTGSTATTRTVNIPKSPILSKVSSNNSVDASNGKTTPNIGAIGSKPGNTPPALPGSSGINPNRTVGSSTAGTTGSGAGSKIGGTGTDLGSGAPTKGSGTGSTGSGSTARGNGTIGGTGSKTSGSGAPTKGSGSSAPTKGSGSSGSRTKEKDK